MAGNVETKGGTHIHHLVWGISRCSCPATSGWRSSPSSPWQEIVAILFGIGMGLTLDEFALWLNLEDVYWTEKGRQSIDAVIVTTCLLAITLLGLQFWIDVLEAGLGFTGGRRQRADRQRERRDPRAASGGGHLPGGRLLHQGQDPHRAGGPVHPAGGARRRGQAAQPGSSWARRRDARTLA